MTIKFFTEIKIFLIKAINFMPKISISILGGVIFDNFFKGFEPFIAIIGGIAGMIIYNLLININIFIKNWRKWKK